MRVIGVGNRWRSDDAAGLVVADRLRGMLAGVEVLEREGEPVGLMDAWEGEDAVVIVDCVTSGATPGTLHRLDAVEAPLPAELFAASTHHFGLAEAVELARVLGRLPETLVVYGVEGSRFDAGEGLSPEVDAALDDAVQAVREEVATCMNRR
jgi:hydrogenase maturation protease